MCVRVKRSWYQLPRSSRLLLFVTLFTIVFLIYYHLQSIPKNIAPRYDVPGPIEPRFMSSISMQNGKFYLNNEELTIYSGAMHYFRVLPAMWRDRMQKMKAAGLNTIETYVAWNVHEEIQGEYQFDGHRDIRKYIQLAQEIGLYVIVRPGPFICAEWEFGGLPSWLLHDPDMIVRSTYLPFLDAANDYLYNLAKEISDLQFVYGGPIIAFQVENEYGSYGSDANYMIMVKRMLHANGYTELLFTSENVDGINNKMDGVLQTANLHDRSTAQRCFEKLRRVQPGLPLFVMELWSGWFDHWNEHHHTTKVQDLKDVLRYLIDNGASINFYMFHGGTNFGFMNGANEAIIDATTTSYDYDSPISENGTLTEKYYLIAELLRPFSNDLPPIKETYRSTAYGRVQMNSMMTFEDILSLNGKPIRSKYPLPMELLPINNDGGQGYGYIVYRKVIGEGRHLEIKGYIQDKAWILLNGRNIGTLNKNYNNPIVGLATDKLKNTVDIIVENTGRNNYVFTAGVTLDDQRKGIIGEVYLDDILLEDWLIYPLEFKENFMKRAITEGHWQSVSGLSGPALWRGDLYIEQYKPKDSFLSVKGWGKGVAFVNDFNLGRYWPSAGPQKNLYLPGPLLKLGNNKILLFEMQSSGHSVGLIEQSVWIE